ncbi:MAG TPA: ABC transporter permease [Candidatus Binatia bacterium]|jgi:NitT/TauT family transport system permease protein|nr:ABC transporter permease [Candidatus Binatia bacterium]
MARLRAIASKGLGLFGILAFFLAWEVASQTHLLNPFYFPPVSQIIAKGIEMFTSGLIWEHMIFSLTNFSVGLITATIVGVLLGIPMGWYKGISRTLDPLLSGIYATPLIALLPLIIMLFGLGAVSKIVMTFLAAVFPVLINTMIGIANTDVNLVKMSRSFGASDATIFRKVSLPGSLPYIVAGVRVALGRALVYIVVAEQYGAAMGLGYLSSVAAQRFQIAAMFAPIVIIACLGAGLTELFKAVERRLDNWKPSK